MKSIYNKSNLQIHDAEVGVMQSIDGFVWEDWVVDKLDWKHGVEPDEVEAAFFNPPYKVRRTKSDKYLLYGRSDEGRYLFVVLSG